MFTWALLVSSLFLLGALALAMCAEQESEDQNDQADQEEQQQQQQQKQPRTSSVSSKEKAPRKTKSKVQSKVQSKMGPSNSKVGGTSKVAQSAVKGGRSSSAAPSAAVSSGAKLLPKKKLSGKGKGKGQARAKDSLSAESAVSEVKSTGADYYAILVKQCTVKSVSQYGMPPPPPPKR